MGRPPGSPGQGFAPPLAPRVERHGRGLGDRELLLDLGLGPRDDEVTFPEFFRSRGRRLSDEGPPDLKAQAEF